MCKVLAAPVTVFSVCLTLLNYINIGLSDGMYSENNIERGSKLLYLDRYIVDLNRISCPIDEVKYPWDPSILSRSIYTVVIHLETIGGDSLTVSC